MHTNHKLNFEHKIGFEIFQDNSSPRLEILINGITVFDETFTANVVHSRTANFYHEYLDRHKNCIEFKFTGTKESANKYVRLENIIVNDTYINVLKYYWNPDINQEWFNKLSENKKNEIKHRVYGNNGTVFGWYGSWKYYFNSGIDMSSKYKGCINNVDNLNIVLRPDWVTLTKNTLVLPWDGNKND